MKYLPSKKFIVIASVVLIGMSVFFIASERQTSTKKSGDNLALVPSTIMHPSSDYKDSDNDGLFDWEEELLGTNPYKSDSDGDGVTDKEEYISQVNTQKGTFPYDIAIARLQGEGAQGQLNFEMQQQVIKTLTQENILEKDHDPYTDENIPHIKDADTIAINSYIANVLLVFRNHPDIIEKDPLDIIQSWLSIQSDDYFEILSSLSKTYSEASADLAHLVVPENFLNSHLNLINSLYHIAQTLKELQLRENDPIKNLMLTARYVHYRNQKRESIITLTQYFDSFAANFLAHKTDSSTEQ